MHFFYNKGIILIMMMMIRITTKNFLKSSMLSCFVDAISANLEGHVRLCKLFMFSCYTKALTCNTNIFYKSSML